MLFTILERRTACFLPARSGGSSLKRQRRELMSREQITRGRIILHKLDLAEV